MRSELIIDNDNSQIWQSITRNASSFELQKKILIIDDRFFIRVYINKILDRPNYELHHAVNIDMGIHYTMILKPDLIILDFSQKDQSKLANFLSEIRKTNYLKHTKTIGISRIRDVEMSYEILNLGADDYINIPFNAITMISKVSKLLAKRNN